MRWFGCVHSCKVHELLLTLFWTLFFTLFSLAVTISNPYARVTIFNVPHTNPSYSAEVAKTRLQLQGELAKDGGKRVYTSAVDALRNKWKTEGIRGIQRGLSPARPPSTSPPRRRLTTAPFTRTDTPQ